MSKEEIYCFNCGKKIPAISKFCSFCGVAIELIESNDTDTRSVYVDKKKPRENIIFEGEIRKCPQCGEVLKSFVLECPACGHEIRGNAPSTNLSDFIRELREIERVGGKGKTKRMANHIMNYPIPTNKEDLLEFMIIASSNIHVGKEGASATISEAWLSKYEQAYGKALICFPDLEGLKEIKASVEKKKEQDIRQRNKKEAFNNWGYIVYMGMFFLFFLAYMWLIN